MSDDIHDRDDRGGRLGDGHQVFHHLDHVLTLRGERWDRDAVQLRRIGRFLDRHLPLPYREGGGADESLYTVDLLQTDSGDELAVIVRRGESGEAGKPLSITIDWQRPHTNMLSLDPFAETPLEPDAPWQAFDEIPIVLPPNCDVMLVLTR